MNLGYLRGFPQPGHLFSSQKVGVPQYKHLHFAPCSRSHASTSPELILLRFPRRLSPLFLK
jgi:hypothetical protein